VASFPGQKSTGSPLPNPPLSLAVTGSTTSTVSLGWTAPVGGASTYNLYRNGVQVQSGIVSTATTDTGLTPGTSYTYYVTGVKPLGEGSRSNQTTGTTGAVPNAPTGLAVTGTTSSSVSLSWTAPVGGASTYNLYRNGTKVQTGIAGTSTTDTGLTASTSYTYNVSGSNSFGEGAQSGPVTGTTQSATGTLPKFHPGHGAWFNNPFYTISPQSNQRADFNSNLGIIANTSNFFNRVKIIFTWANISDPTLTGGAQTFNIFRTNLTDVLTTLRARTTKKIYLDVEFWQGAFYSTFIGNATSVSGNTITLTTGFGSVGTGGKICSCGGNTRNVLSSTSTTITLDGSPGIGADGQFVLSTAKVNDTAMWPSWVISASPAMVQVFIQPNTAGRGQLANDNPVVWSRLQEMYTGMLDVIDSLDTDIRVDRLMTADESETANVDINGKPICSAANYISQFKTLHLNLAANMSSRTVRRTLWAPMSYYPSDGGTQEIDGLQDFYTSMNSAYPSGILYGGPDPACYGTHSTQWANTFQNLIAGVSGSLGDIRDSANTTNNCEGQGMGTGSNFSGCPPPSGSNQAFFDDTMTRKSLTTHGAHTGYGAKSMIWNFQTSICLNTTSITALVNANSGFVTPLVNPSLWDTSP